MAEYRSEGWRVYAHLKPLLMSHPLSFHWFKYDAWPGPASVGQGNTLCLLSWEVLQSHMAKGKDAGGQ